MWGERSIMSLLLKCLSLCWSQVIIIANSSRKEAQKKYHFVTLGDTSLVENLSHKGGGCYF